MILIINQTNPPDCNNFLFSHAKHPAGGWICRKYGPIR